MKFSKEQLFNYSKVAAFLLLVIFVHLKYEEHLSPQVYPGGQKKSVGVYKNGKPDGTWTWWYENGQKMMEGVFVGGKRSGIWNTWYTNGQVKSNGLYSNDMLNGRFVAWHSNGNIKHSGNYLKDKLHGLQQFYDQLGTLIKEQEFSNGEELKNSDQ